MEGLCMVSDRIVDFRFFIKFGMSDLQKFSFFELSPSMLAMHQKKAPNQVKNLINMVSVTLDGLWMISDRIVNIRIFANVHRS